MELPWATDLVRQCREARGVTCFVKQIATAADPKGGNPKHWPTGEWPREWPERAAGGPGL